MSEREMRDVLAGVIEDIDSGRLVMKRRTSSLFRMVAPPAMAAMIALGAGCVMEYGVPDYGVPPVDSGIDAGADAAWEVDAEIDSGSTEDYGVPDVDGGP